MLQLCKVLKVKARQLQLRSAASSLREVRSSTEHNAAGFAGSEAEQCVAALRASSCETEYCWPALWQLLPESRCGPGTRATVGAGTVPGPFPVPVHCAIGTLCQLCHRERSTMPILCNTGYTRSTVPAQGKVLAQHSAGKAASSWYWQNSNWAKHAKSPKQGNHKIVGKTKMI